MKIEALTREEFDSLGDVSYREEISFFKNEDNLCSVIGQLAGSIEQNIDILKRINPYQNKDIIKVTTEKGRIFLVKIDY